LNNDHHIGAFFLRLKTTVSLKNPFNILIALPGITQRREMLGSITAVCYSL